MKYCKKCHTYYHHDIKLCDVCGRSLVETDFKSKLVTQGYPEVKVLKETSRFIMKIFSMISIGISVLLVVVNWMTYSDYPMLWSLLVIGPIAYAWLLLFQVVISKHDYPTKVVRQVFFISLILIAVDFFTEFRSWSLTYVIPFMLAATTLILPIMIASNPVKYYLHVRTLLFLVILNLSISILAFTTNLWIDTATWTAVMSGFSGVFLLLSMFVFARKTTWNELVKIFRI